MWHIMPLFFKKKRKEKKIVIHEPEETNTQLCQPSQVLKSAIELISTGLNCELYLQ
jgi:hypothetical protein